MPKSTAAKVPAPTEEFFRALETKRTRALVDRDLATLDELHAPYYQLITPTGKAFSRERYLAAIAAEPFYTEWVVGEMMFRLSAQMAVVRYQARLRFPSGHELVCWHTDTYELRAGRWQAVWSHATEIPVAAVVAGAKSAA